jgi:predicted CXXCH cytochrome family protein
MARSFGVVRPGTEAARTPPGKFHHTLTEQNYVVSRRNGKLYLSRSTTGYDGKPADLLEAEMSYWIGSGSHARSYLSRGIRGKLVQLPLTWYSEGGGHWWMSPGYDVSFHAGFSRKITYACLFCHAGYPDLSPGIDQYDEGWKLPESLGEGSDCQRCHGPGQAHVDAAKSGQGVDRVRVAIVNPGKLDPRRGMEVCLQCHLETTTVRLPGFLRNYDRGVFSYRAGEPLEDSILFFKRSAEQGERVDFTGEAYRLGLSRCFRESKGALTCMTCHNPHDVPRGDAAPRYYARICLGCHGAALTRLAGSGRHATSQDCVACHMPRRKPVDALQTVVLDHFIRKGPMPEPQKSNVEYNDSTAVPYRGEVVLYYPPALAETPMNELYLAVAQVKQRANLDGGLPRLDALIGQTRPAQGQFYLDLAAAWLDTGQPRKAVEYARQGVERMQGNWRAWFAWGNTLVGAGDLSQAADVLKRAAGLAPDEPNVAQALGETYMRLGRLMDALAAYRSAVAADPEFAEGHNDVGTTLLRLGDRVGALKELREAVRLRPESAAMQVNLATLLATGHAGDGMSEARKRFDLALKMNPEFAEGHAAYGAALGAMRDWAEARSHLEAATRLNPKAPVPHHNLGVVLLELSDTDGALRQFQTAVDLNPNYYEAQLKVALLLTGRGQLAEAEPHLRKAAESPDMEVKGVAVRLLAK